MPSSKPSAPRGAASAFTGAGAPAATASSSYVPHALGELALSSQPLTAATSLLRLLAPDVQNYIMERQQEGGHAAAPPASSAAAAPPQPLRLSSNQGVAMRVATSIAGAEASDAAATTGFGRRRAQQPSALPRGSPSAASLASSSSASPPRGASTLGSTSSRRGRRSAGGLGVGHIDAAASVHAQMAADFAASTAAAAAASATAAAASPAEPAEAKTNSSVPASGGISRASKVQQRDALALLHRSSTVPASSAVDDASAAAAGTHGVTFAAEGGGPRLFHAQSKDLLASGPHSARSTTRTLSEPRSGALLSVRSSHKQLGMSRRNFSSGLHGGSTYSLGGPHSSLSQSSLHSMASAAAECQVAHFSPSPTRYPLPPPHSPLDPLGSESFTAAPWHHAPAAASKHALPHVSSTAAHHSTSLTASDLVEDSSLSKPRLLAELEQFIALEMRTLGLSDRSPPSFARLAIYRDAFRVFLDEFPSYKSLLARVAREYEQLLRQQEEQLSTMPSLKARLATLQQETDEQLARERVAEQQRAQKTFEEAESLREQIASLQVSLASMRQTHESTCAELGSLQSSHAQLLQSHSTLNSALSRSGLERSTAWEAQQIEQELNRALQQKVGEYKKQQEALLHELSLLRSHAAHLSQSCTPADLARLHEENESLSSSSREWESKYRARSEEYFSLLTTHESVVRERDQLVAEAQSMEELKRCSTPRPLWGRLLEQKYLPDSCNLSLQSSESLVDEMCSELDRLRGEVHQWQLRYPSEQEVAALDAALATDGLRLQPATHLRVRGSGTEVPLYLRWGSKPGLKIRNKNLSKRETEIVIKECWAMKMHTPDDQGGREYRSMSLVDFMYIFLKKKCGFQEAIAHYAYALLDALERYRFDGDCDMFLQILNAQLPESVYVDQLAQLASLRAAFIAADAAEHKGRIKGRLPRKVLLDCLAKFYPNKSDSSLRRISRALYVTDRSETLAYAALFEEDREGNQGPFLECIRDQHLQEIAGFMTQLENKMLEKARRYGGQLSLAQVREIIQVVDPLKPAKEVEAYLRAGCDLGLPPAPTLPPAPGSSPSKSSSSQSAAPPPPLLAPAPPAPLPDDATLFDPAIFFSNMSRLLIKRTGPEPVEKTELARKGSITGGEKGSQSAATAAAAAAAGAERSSISTPEEGEGKMPGGFPSSTSRVLSPPGANIGSNQSTPQSTPQKGGTIHSPPQGRSHARTVSTGRPAFSDVARRISVAGAPPNLANVVLLARQASLQQGQTSPPANTTVSAAAAIAAVAASKPQTPLTALGQPGAVKPITPLTPLSPATQPTASQARAAASHASLDRLTSFVLARAERQREEAAQSASPVPPPVEAVLPPPGAGSDPRQTQVLQLRREGGEEFAAERAKILERVLSVGSGFTSGLATPEPSAGPGGGEDLDLESSSLSVQPSALAALVSPMAPVASASRASSLPQQVGPATAPRNPRGSGGPPLASLSVPLASGDASHSEPGSAGSASAAQPPSTPSPSSASAASASAPAPASASSSNAIFSPTSSSIIASRKSLRLSMRKSGGLALLLANQARLDPTEADPDLDLSVRQRKPAKEGTPEGEEHEEDQQLVS